MNKKKKHTATSRRRKALLRTSGHTYDALAALARVSWRMVKYWMDDERASAPCARAFDTLTGRTHSPQPASRRKAHSHVGTMRGRLAGAANLFLVFLLAGCASLVPDAERACKARGFTWAEHFDVDGHARGYSCSHVPRVPVSGDRRAL